jgi:hypothetical protein
MRARSVVILSWLYITVGVVGLIYHAFNWSPDEPPVDQGWVLLLRVLAIVGGVFTLRGAVWSRWLLVAWIAYHVFLSLGHSTSQLVVHSVLFALTALVMFRVPLAPRAPRGPNPS